MDNIITQSSLTYVKHQQEITRLKRIIERHEDKIECIRDKAWWGSVLIKPIMNAVKIKFPFLIWDERMATMGLKYRVPMFGKDKDGEIIASVTFVPEDLTKGVISFETGELIGPKGGYDTHGFNLKTEIITDIEQIFNHIQKRLDSNNKN